MAHSGRRSPKAFVRRLAFKYGYRDRRKGETIHILSKDFIMVALSKEYGEVDMSIVDLEKGEVLIDCRGKGSFQITTSIGC